MPNFLLIRKIRLIPEVIMDQFSEMKDEDWNQIDKPIGMLINDRRRLILLVESMMNGFIEVHPMNDMVNCTIDNVIFSPDEFDYMD